MWTSKELDAVGLFFIVGRIRSGTTLMNNVLNTYSEIFIPQESPFILYLFNKYSEVEFWSNELLLSFYTDLWTENRLTQFWELDQEKENLKKVILHLGENATFERLCKLVILFQAKRFGKTPSIIGDKNPSYTLYLPTLKKLFPTAKFIMMVRDPRPNILSCQKVSWDFNNSFILAGRWRYCADIINEFKSKNNSNICMISFEDLMLSPSHELERVSNYLDITYSSELLNFHKRKEKLKSWDSFYLRPIKKEKIEEWKGLIEVDELASIEYICADQMELYNYKPESTSSLQLITKFKCFIFSQIGDLSNFLESIIYFFPLWFKSGLLKFYRKQTKTL